MLLGVMTATELLRFQLDDGTFQLKACLEPMTDAQLDTRPAPGGMTPRETAVHLCECYEAFLAECEGRKHPWGSYAVSDTSKENLLSHLWATRQRAAAVALEKEDQAQHAHAFLVAHDCYHVGQLCLVLMTTNPEWDPYSIYQL